MSNDMRRDFQPALYWRCVEALSFSLGSKCAGGLVDSNAVNEIAKKLKREVYQDRTSRTATDGGVQIVYEDRDKGGNTVATIRVDRAACAAFS